MRDRILAIGAMLAIGVFGAATASADTVQYTVNSAYGADAPTTSLITPNTAFTFTFGEPLPVVPGSSDAMSFTTTVPISYVSGGKSFSGSGDVAFFDAGNGGLFNIMLDGVFWNFDGVALFTGTTGSPTLTPGTFTINTNDNSFVNEGDTFSNLQGGSIEADLNSTVATPEPGSLALLASGLAIMACFLRRKVLVAA